MNRPGVGYANSIMEGLFVWFGRQVDMNALRNVSAGCHCQQRAVQPRVQLELTTSTTIRIWMQYQNPLQDVRDSCDRNRRGDVQAY